MAHNKTIKTNRNNWDWVVGNSPRLGEVWEQGIADFRGFPLDDADHTFSGGKWEKDVFEITFKWIKKSTKVEEKLVS